MESKSIKQIGQGYLILGNALEVLKDIPDESIDLVFTDPPYNVSRENNYSTMGQTGIDFGQWDWDFDQTTWLQELNRIVKPNGSILIFNSVENMGLLVNELDRLGFKKRDFIRWIKPNPIPRNRDRRYVIDYEMLLWATKKQGKWTFNRWPKENFVIPEYYSALVSHLRIHPTQKPLKMIKQIIKRHSNVGDMILDPFSGSGTIALAAQELNRCWVAIEIDKHYYQQSLKRLTGEVTWILD